MGLPDAVTKGLDVFVEEAKRVFRDRLRSVVLYGSAAEDRLRRTSDVNLVLVVRSYTKDDAAALASMLGLTAAAIDLQVMFLLESELVTASDLFAVKFADISRRHKVLFGSDPFADLGVSKEALVGRLQQVLLNHLIRLRYVVALQNNSSEKLTQILADSASPLRASASGILEIEGVAFDNPKQALQLVAQQLRDDGFKEVLAAITEVREGKVHSIDQTRSLLAGVMELTERLMERTRLPV